VSAPCCPCTPRERRGVLAIPHRRTRHGSPSPGLLTWAYFSEHPTRLASRSVEAPRTAHQKPRDSEPSPLIRPNTPARPPFTGAYGYSGAPLLTSPPRIARDPRNGRGVRISSPFVVFAAACPVNVNRPAAARARRRNNRGRTRAAMTPGKHGGGGELDRRGRHPGAPQPWRCMEPPNRRERAVKVCSGRSVRSPRVRPPGDLPAHPRRTECPRGLASPRPSRISPPLRMRMTQPPAGGNEGEVGKLT